MNMLETRRMRFYTVCIILIFIIGFCACNNDNHSGDGGNNPSSITNSGTNDETSPLEILYNKILKEDDYEAHYFGQWDMETNYPYANLDDFYEDTKHGFFKFFYDKDKRIVQHVRMNGDLPERIADYKYASDGSITVSWTKNYNYKTANYNGIDIIEYYPNGRVKSLSEYEIDEEGNKNLKIKSVYSEMETTEEIPSNITKYYNSDGKEMVYAKTEFQKNMYSKTPEYLKSKETRYISFGSYKDMWFSITRYDDTGEVSNVLYNETDMEDGLIPPDYIRQEFPEMFSN